MSKKLDDVLEGLKPDPSDSPDIAEYKASLRQAVYDTTVELEQFDMSQKSKSWMGWLRRTLFPN